MRRQWPEHFGAKGAQIIYGQMFKALVNRRFPTQLLRYPEMVSRPRQHARLLARIAGVEASPEQLEKAAAFVRRVQPAAGAAAAAGAAVASPAADQSTTAKSDKGGNKAAGKSGKKA